MTNEVNAEKLSIPFDSTKPIRSTKYCDILAESIIYYDNGSEMRLERIYTKEYGAEEIRLSWWKNGNIIPRPADVDAIDWNELFDTACKNNVFNADEKLGMIQSLLSDK